MEQLGKVQIKPLKVITNTTKTGTSKVGAISKAQNAVFKTCKGRSREKLLFSNLRLLLTETQYSSDITSIVRILSFTPDITKRDIDKIEGTLWIQKNRKKIEWLV